MTHNLVECSICGGGETTFSDSMNWTGMRNQLICTTIRHFCAEQEDSFDKITMQIRARTRESATKLWNKVHYS